ncbi:hypothetical protein [Candidatus Amarobacter glycogenicus]|uniref:hypothetical protein n=1 Tax=Candidatus Amarobacter glycogenicus TaxID=3140699 RepID=UPI002A0F5673|nr:hypothetical protein [Dehalococcoidia bacterium]
MAHELLHVLFMRQGYPGIEFREKSVPIGIPELANLIDDAVIHPVLWRDLRRRGFDDSAYWNTELLKLNTAGGAELPLAAHTGTLCDAIAFADIVASSGLAPDPLFTSAEPHSPVTVSLAKQFCSIITHDNGTTPESRAAGMESLITKVDDVLIAAGFQYFRLRTWVSVSR